MNTATSSCPNSLPLRRKLVMTSLALMAAGAAACAGWSSGVLAQAKLETVTVSANRTSVNHIYAYWGKERGFFAKYGIDVQIIDNVADPVAALAGGQIQFISNGVQLQQAAARGVPLKTIMVTAKDNLGIYAGAAIKTIQDLRGKRIIAPYDSVKYVLRRNGVDPDKEVTWVVSRGAPQVNLELVRRGQADAFSSFPASRTLAEELGLHEVFTVAKYIPGGPAAVVGTTDKIIAERAPLVANFLRASLDAIQSMRGDREGIYEYTKRVMNYSRGASEEAYEVVLRDMPADGLTTDEALRATLESVKKGQGNTQNLPVSQVWNFGPLREVLKSRK